MKKTMKYMALAMMAIFSLTFVACSSDDDDKKEGNGGSVDKGQLIGLWELTSEVNSVDYKGEHIEQPVNEKGRIRINEDNTMYVYDWENNQYVQEMEEKHTWKLSGNTFTVSVWYNGTLQKSTDMTITSVTSKKLVLVVTEKMNGYTIKGTSTYQRID